MDNKTLSNLIEQSKKGSRKAMEKLLIFAYTPVFWQCCRLLNDQQLAEEMTERILKGLSSQIDKIEDADHFHKWLGNITAARCMRKREQVIIKDYIAKNQNLSFPNNELSKTETAQVALILADSLPEEHRICLILSDCCRVGTKNITQLTGFTEEAVTKYIAEAELGIRKQMQVYENQGVVFASSLAVGALLRTAMYGKQDRSAAVAMVRRVLPPVAPAPAPVKPPKRTNNTVKILLCVAVALVLLVVLLICGSFMHNRPQDIEETILPSTTAATTVTETTGLATEATVATTESTTEPTSEATIVPETTKAVETTEAIEVPVPTTPKSTSKPITNTGSSTTNNTTTKPVTDPNYDPGKGEDGHTHVFFTVPAGQNATCTRAARIHRLCRLCSFGITVDDPDNPALGHNYQSHIIVAPTTSSKGYTSYRCTRCGDTYDADFVDPLPAPETQPTVVETNPPVIETQPPVIETNPPVIETQPPVVATNPPVIETQPPVVEANPPIIE